MNIYEAFNVIKEYYDHAWNQLIFFVTITVTLFGLILPIALNFFQFRTSKKRIKKLENNLKVITKRYKVIEQETKDIMGSVFILQGNMLLNDEDSSHVSSFISYLRGLLLYLEGENEIHIKSAIDILKDINRFGKLSSDSFKKEPKLKEVISNVIVKLKENNKNGGYTDILNYLKNILNLSS